MTLIDNYPYNIYHVDDLSLELNIFISEKLDF